MNFNDIWNRLCEIPLIRNYDITQADIGYDLMCFTYDSYGYDTDAPSMSWLNRLFKELNGTWLELYLDLRSLILHWQLILSALHCAWSGHDWVDESYGGPDSGCMAASCRRCPASFHRQLY